MKFIVTVNNRKCLSNAAQLENFIEVLSSCEVYEEVYVGTNKGTTGSNNAYNPAIKPVSVGEWFDAKIMRDDFVDTIKLRMKLDADNN